MEETAVLTGPLIQIHQEADRRARAVIEQAGGAWPCHQGCDDCCRSLAAEPQITEAEWRLLAPAVHALGVEVRERILANAGAKRPVTCALLDRETGSCRVYDVRPVACRTYGFYAERGSVLGCGRIEQIALQSPEIIWGNHSAIEQQQLSTCGGATAPLSQWVQLETTLLEGGSVEGQ